MKAKTNACGRNQGKLLTYWGGGGGAAETKFLLVTFSDHRFTREIVLPAPSSSPLLYCCPFSHLSCPICTVLFEAHTENTQLSAPFHPAQGSYLAKQSSGQLTGSRKSPRRSGA